jgi:hypothetical protein
MMQPKRQAPHPIAIVAAKEWGTLVYQTELLRERDSPEQSICVVIRTSRKEKLIRSSVVGIPLPELDRPELIYLHDTATGITKRPQEFTF